MDYEVRDSFIRNQETLEPLKEVVPSKNRCGSSDPVEMTEDTKCFCKAKDGEGAKEGVVLKLEMVNIPFEQDLLDLRSSLFVETKRLVEKTVREVNLSTFLVLLPQFSFSFHSSARNRPCLGWFFGGS